MDVCIIPGPGNAQELVDSLTRTQGARLHVAARPRDLQEADLLITPRGPSRSFGRWYQEDTLGQAVLSAHQTGVPWIAFCGSALPLCSQHGPGCEGVPRLSIIAMKGTNDRLFGQENVRTAAGQTYPFDFTSAPSFDPLERTELLASSDGYGVVLRAEDLIVSAGLPLTPDAWMYLFEAAGMPLAGAKSG